MEKNDSNNIMLKIARKVSEMMISEKIIDINRKEYMIYAIELSIENIISIVSVLVLGLISGYLAETIIYLICFFSLRKYTGGFHCRSIYTCYLLTITSYIILLIIYNYVKDNDFIVNIITISVIISYLLILRIGTVNHPNLCLSMDELCVSRNRARIMATMIFILLFVSEKIGIGTGFLFFSGIAVILCAISLILAKIIKQEVRI